MTHPCVNDWCPVRTNRPGEKCWQCAGWAMKIAILKARGCPWYLPVTQGEGAK